MELQKDVIIAKVITDIIDNLENEITKLILENRKLKLEIEMLKKYSSVEVKK